MFDIIISNGKVYDGTGSEPRALDIGIAGDAIAELGDLSSAESRLRINASGKCVCPGFIDVHSHSDAFLLIEPSAQSKIYQGITTEIVGNCGASAAPLFGKYHMPSDWEDKTFPGKWSTVAEYRQLLDKTKPAVNVAMLIGHNTLRAGAAGYVNRELTCKEMEDVIRFLEESLEQGGCGLSMGLIYTPGMFAPRKELIELAKVTAKHGGIVTAHMRSESGKLLSAIDEMIEVGRKAGVRIEISHLKTSGRSNWGLLDGALHRIRDARASGLDICADRYPYTAGSTELDVVFPDWAEEGGREAVIKRLKDAPVRARIRDELAKAKSADDWATVTIGSTAHPDNKRFTGMPLAEAAKLLNMEPADAVLHIVEKDELKTTAFFFGMSEENMKRIFIEPYVMICTDASLRAPAGPLSRDFPHPRAYGSFPRFIRMVLDNKWLPFAEAIRKMTSLPAEHFRIKGRGVIARGNKADIVVFDQDRVRDKADYSNPHRLSEGMEHVIVNGVLTVSNSALTGKRAGKFI